MREKIELARQNTANLAKGGSDPTQENCEGERDMISPETAMSFVLPSFLHCPPRRKMELYKTRHLLVPLLSPLPSFRGHQGGLKIAATEATIAL